MPQACIYRPGAKVMKRSERSQVGIIMGEGQRIAGEFWYSVFFGGGYEKKVPESDLEPFEGVVDVDTLLKRGSFDRKETLSKIVTYTKLSTPLRNTVYSFYASRTTFFPFQFKPLVKFLDSPKQRLLIADEVGLGKTIEAGLILSEQRERHSLDRVLIVCPSSLCDKWRQEMLRRFDEDFTVLNSEGFRRFLRDLEGMGEGTRLRGICSLQMLRSRSILEEIRASSPPFDLVIMDEAHHMRNSGTLSNQLGEVLSESSDAMLLLTATPIHMGNENLFNLLRVLDPGEFDILPVFRRRLTVNEHVIGAQRLVGASLPCDLSAVKGKLQRLEATEERARFLENPIYNDVLVKLDEYDGSRRDHVVELQRDISMLNVLSHVLTRTRKSEVKERRPKREAHVVKVVPTAEEVEFYQRVTDFIIEKYRGRLGAVGTLVSITSQRQLASCMPAMAEHYLSLAEREIGGIDKELSDQTIEDWSEGNEEENQEKTRLEEELAALIASADVLKLSKVDSKFEALVRVLREIEQAEPGRKVLVFSYFKKTLSYLARRLKEAEQRCLLLSGDIPSNPADPEKDERGKVLRRFRTDPEAKILLSSEVGSEGLDFEFCHILLNYDLPWNPMVVEQRIGRLDRITQKAERILIFNFAIPGTIEDRILNRLYNRIRIFEQSIGDLEAILGEEIKVMTLDLLRSKLTPQEQESIIDKVAEVIERRRQDSEILERQSGRFIGHDEYFTDEIQRITKLKRYLTAQELDVFLREFLERECPKCLLDPIDGGQYQRLTVDDKLQEIVRRSATPGDPLFHQFLVRCTRGELKVTFDSQVASEDTEVEFLSAHHPLLRAVRLYYKDNQDSLHPVAKVALGKAPVAGKFLYRLYLVEMTGARHVRTLESSFINLDTSDVLDSETSEVLLSRIVTEGKTCPDDPLLTEVTIDEMARKADEVFIARIGEKERELRRINDALVANRIASLEASFKAKETKKLELLDRAKRGGKDPRYIRMLEGGLKNIRNDYERKRAEIEAGRTVRKEYSLIAAGYLEATR